MRSVIDPKTDPIIVSCPPGQLPRLDWEEHQQTECPHDRYVGQGYTERERQLLAVLNSEVESYDATVGDERSEVDGGGRWRGQAEAMQLMQLGGWTFERLAETLDIDVERIAKLFCTRYEDAPKVVKAEALIASGEWDRTVAQLVEVSGLSVQMIQRTLLPSLGQKSDAQDKLSRGGGTKYGPEIYEAIERMRGEGQSYGSIAKALSIGRSSVIQICRRRGFKTPVERDREQG